MDLEAEDGIQASNPAGFEYREAYGIPKSRAQTLSPIDQA